MSQENIDSMVNSIREGNINSFQKEFNLQMKENIGRSIEIEKETIATNMFNKESICEEKTEISPGTVMFSFDDKWKKITYKNLKDLKNKTKATDVDNIEDNIEEFNKIKIPYTYIDPYGLDMSNEKQKSLYFAKDKKTADYDMDQSARSV